MLKQHQTLISSTNIPGEPPLCQALENTAENNINKSSPSILRRVMKEGFIRGMTLRQISGQCEKSQTQGSGGRTCQAKGQTREMTLRQKQGWPFEGHTNPCGCSRVNEKENGGNGRKWEAL